jgi:hypothetical protein
VTAELSLLDRSATAFVATGERILELVKQAGILYKQENGGVDGTRSRGLRRDRHDFTRAKFL